MYSRLDTISACDGQIHRRTDTAGRQRPRYMHSVARVKLLIGPYFVNHPEDPDLGIFQKNTIK